jgi:anti-sigma B factor antagonist
VAFDRVGAVLIGSAAPFLCRFVDAAPTVRYDAGLFLDAADASLRPGADGHSGTHRGDPQMQIEERIVGDVTILDLKGKMTLGEGDELLKDKINSLIHQGQKNLLLNLEGVPYIDSAGLGEIVRTYTTVSRQGGALKLVNLTKRITDLLSITKLLTVFETFDLEKDAVASFQSSAKA